MLPPAAFLVACAIASGACGAQVAIEPGPPAGFPLPAGLALGDPCDGEIFFEDSGAYVACIDGEWTYEDPTWAIPTDYCTDPAFAGYNCPVYCGPNWSESESESDSTETEVEGTTDSNDPDAGTTSDSSDSS